MRLSRISTVCVNVQTLHPSTPRQPCLRPVEEDLQKYAVAGFSLVSLSARLLCLIAEPITPASRATITLTSIENKMLAKRSCVASRHQGATTVAAGQRHRAKRRTIPDADKIVLLVYHGMAWVDAARVADLPVVTLVLGRPCRQIPASPCI